jgi:hypothetical protein
VCMWGWARSMCSWFRARQDNGGSCVCACVMRRASRVRRTGTYAVPYRAVLHKDLEQTNNAYVAHHLLIYKFPSSLLLPCTSTMLAVPLSHLSTLVLPASVAPNPFCEKPNPPLNLPTCTVNPLLLSLRCSQVRTYINAAYMSRLPLQRRHLRH